MYKRSRIVLSKKKIYNEPNIKGGHEMKAAVFYGKVKIILEEHEYKKPGGDEVLIKVKAAGICGTDMHIYDGAKGASECYPPVVLGHEFAGIVTEVGADVTDIKAGDHVTVDPSIVCNECYECLSGKTAEHFIVL